MTLQELLLAVKEENLTKQQLEAYHLALTGLWSEMFMEIAELEKKEALYFLNHGEKSDVAAVRKWKGSPNGLRLIELDNHAKVVARNLKSLQSRMYSTY